MAAEESEKLVPYKFGDIKSVVNLELNLNMHWICTDIVTWSRICNQYLLDCMEYEVVLASTRLLVGELLHHNFAQISLEMEELSKKKIIEEISESKNKSQYRLID